MGQFLRGLGLREGDMRGLRDAPGAGGGAAGILAGPRARGSPCGQDEFDEPRRRPKSQRHATTFRFLNVRSFFREEWGTSGMHWRGAWASVTVGC